MAKKKNKPISIGVITKEQRFEAEKPRYNAIKVDMVLLKIRKHIQEKKNINKNYIKIKKKIWRI